MTAARRDRKRAFRAKFGGAYPEELNGAFDPPEPGRDTPKPQVSLERWPEPLYGGSDTGWDLIRKSAEANLEYPKISECSIKDQ